MTEHGDQAELTMLDPRQLVCVEPVYCDDLLAAPLPSKLHVARCGN